MLWNKREEEYIKTIKELTQELRDVHQQLFDHLQKDREVMEDMNQRNIELAELLKAVIELKMKTLDSED